MPVLWYSLHTQMPATSLNLAHGCGAHIFLSQDDPVLRHNMPVLTISQIIKYVMAFAAEAELAALYITARELIPLRNALTEMGWTQPKTPIQTDNSTATCDCTGSDAEKPQGNSASIGIADLPTWQITVRSTTHLHITWRIAPRMQSRSPM
eukprot:CCRYP_016816-RA/>CCRYP_016816-RA protein AED:0.49 eAED:0.52 QI:0/0/0/1/0/0/2/0/150